MIACLMFSSASASVVPCDQHPGNPGTETASPSSEAQHQLVHLYALAGLVNVDAHEAPRGVVVQYDTFGDLAALDAWLFRKVDIERVCVGEVTEFHGLNPRSGTAFRMATLSASVITRK